MLSARKVRLMTRLAMYEQKEGKEDIHLSKYYKTDYVRLQTMRTIVAATVGYVIVLMMLATYKSEYLIKEAVNLNYPDILRLILGAYIIVLIVFISASILGYSIYYTKSRKKLAKYFRMLRKLRSIYREESGEFERAGEEEEE